MSTTSLYLDTSCLLKLFFQEPESASVAAIVSAQDEVIVSELAVLEASVQIHGRRIAGDLSRSRARILQSALERIISMQPFQVLPFAGATLGYATAQFKHAKKAAHCRTLDRLHLAVMEAHGLQRLLTHDAGQARAARALGFEVLTT